MGQRREFLKTLGGAAAVTLTSSVPSFAGARALSLRATVAGAEGPDRLPVEWYKKKIAQVQAELEKRKLDALLLLNATNIIYTTGYFHLTTERPLAALIPKSGEPALFIPELEVDRSSCGG